MLECPTDADRRGCRRPGGASSCRVEMSPAVGKCRPHTPDSCWAARPPCHRRRPMCASRGRDELRRGVDVEGRLRRDGAKAGQVVLEDGHQRGPILTIRALPPLVTSEMRRASRFHCGVAPSTARWPRRRSPPARAFQADRPSVRHRVELHPECGVERGRASERRVAGAIVRAASPSK
jgi:hypothetical protein